MPLTVQLSSQETFLALDVQFKPDLQADELDHVVDELETQIRQDHQNIGKIFIEVEKLKGHQERNRSG